MKKEGSLKLILAILVAILVCLVSIGGIYVKEKNIMKNILPDYTLGMELDTNTIIKLEAQENDKGSSEDTKEDDEEKDDELENEESEQSESDLKDGQAEVVYTVENYKETKKILEKRLNDAKIEQYTIRLDEKSGNIVLEVPSNTDTKVLQNIFVIGKTEIKINENKEVIGDYNSFSKITTAIDNSYESYGIGSFVKLDVEFSKDAIKKFEEVKNNYVIPTDEEGKETENHIEICIDGSAICSIEETEFLDAAVKGNISLKLGNYTKEKEELNDTLQEANIIKNIIKNGNLPVTYSIKYSNDIHSDISELGVISVFAIILVVMLGYLLFKYKLKGLLAELSILSFGALLLLVLRYTNVQISVESIVSIAGMLILQFIYLTKLLNSKTLNSKIFTEKTIEFTKMLIPAFIMSVIIAFANILEISGFGMVIFWGVILFEIFNNIITRAILTNVKNK